MLQYFCAGSKLSIDDQVVTVLKVIHRVVHSYRRPQSLLPDFAAINCVDSGGIPSATGVARGKSEDEGGH